MHNLPETKAFTIKDKVFYFSVATRIYDLMQGLAGLESLSPIDGMLFDFGFETNVTMTPKGLLFPVDLAFISEAGEVKQITKLDPAFPFPEYSNEDVRYALEVPLNWFSEHQIAIGDKLF